MSRRRPEVTETRLPAEGRVHPPGCTCAESECVGRSIKLDVSAVDAPGLARCDGYEAEALEAHRVRMVGLLRAEGDVDVAAAARRGGA